MKNPRHVAVHARTPKLRKTATGETPELTAEHVAQLAQAEQLKELLEKGSSPTASDAPKRETFLLSHQDGQAISGCSKGDERAACQWLFSGLFPVLEHNADSVDGSKLWTLAAAKALLLSSAPKTPLESMLIAQMMATHELAMAFGRRALQAQNSDVSGKLAERFARLADVACRQAECIQRLRGEAGRQSVTVQHLHVSDGSQAVIGQLNRGEGPKNDDQVA